jgi:hypothetical protein
VISENITIMWAMKRERSRSAVSDPGQRRARSSLRAIAGGVVPLVLLATPGLAFASERHGGPSPSQSAPIQGTLIRVDNQSLQIQTATSGLTLSLTGSTHIVRVVSGSLVDVWSNEHVDLHMVKGTSTVDTIRVDAAKGMSGHRELLSIAPSTLEFSIVSMNALPAIHPGTLPSHTVSAASGQLSGVVLAVSKASITLRDLKGKTVSFGLSDSVTVTKLLDGTAADLATGEKVLIFKGRHGNCAVVEILNS